MNTEQKALHIFATELYSTITTYQKRIGDPVTLECVAEEAKTVSAEIEMPMSTLSTEQEITSYRNRILRPVADKITEALPEEFRCAGLPKYNGENVYKCSIRGLNIVLYNRRVYVSFIPGLGAVEPIVTTTDGAWNFRGDK